MGTPVTLPELVATTAGTVPDIRVGLLITPVGFDEDCVAMDDAEFDLAGEGGLCEAALTEAGGDGAVNELAELRCW